MGSLILCTVCVITTCIHVLTKLWLLMYFTYLTYFYGYLLLKLWLQYLFYYVIFCVASVQFVLWCGFYYSIIQEVWRHPGMESMLWLVLWCCLLYVDRMFIPYLSLWLLELTLVHDHLLPSGERCDVHCQLCPVWQCVCGCRGPANRHCLPVVGGKWLDIHVHMHTHTHSFLCQIRMDWFSKHIGYAHKLLLYRTVECLETFELRYPHPHPPPTG